MSTLCVVTTSGRPKVFNEYLTKILAKQTTKDFRVLVATDDYEGYKFDKSFITIKRDNSDDKMSSLNENWIAALDWIDKHPDYDKILCFEDDDYYNREYVVETTAMLDKSDLFGWHKDAYYYVLSRKARRLLNVGYACLASTAFTRKVLPYFRECVMQGNVFIDNLLWKGIRETSYMNQPPISLNNGQTMQPPPMEYSKLISSFKGKRLLADNFTGVLYNQEPEIRYDAGGKLQMVIHQAIIDPDTGLIKDEHPRHVGMKEPFHGGKFGTSFQHDPRVGGGSDMLGNKLKEWIGNEDAKMYLKYTSDPPKPYPPLVMVDMPLD